LADAFVDEEDKPEVIVQLAKTPGMCIFFIILSILIEWNVN
jgi:hypothetical protein